MKLSLITLIRNEQDILNVFLNHVDALFDEVYILDHRSLNSTSEILRKAANQRKGFRYIPVEINGFYQKEISTLIMRHLFDKGSDCVFFLDCDEFFHLKDRNELERKLQELAINNSVGSVRWINCFPDKLNSRRLHYRSTLWCSSESSPFSKVIIPRSVYEGFNGNISMAQGNHLVYDSDGNPLNAKEIGFLLHIPIRSKQQLISKVLQSSLSNFSRTTKKPGEGFQYKEMLKMILKSQVSPDDVRGCVNLYQKAGKNLPVAKKDLKSEKWMKSSLAKMKVANSKRFTFKTRYNDQIQFNERIIADHILSADNADHREIIFLNSESIVTFKK